MSETTPLRPLRLVLAIAGVVLVLAAALAWLNRRNLAREALVGWLKGKGVAADVQVEAVGPSEFVARLRLGDPAHPDFVADRALVRYRLTAAGAQVTAVTLTHPVLRATFHGGRWSAGSLDPLVREFLAKPPQPGAPKPQIAVDGGRLLLATDYGPLDITANARVAEGRLTDFNGSAAPTRLRGPGFDLATGGGQLDAVVRGGRIAARLATPISAAQAGGAQLRDARLQVALDTAYPDLARPALDQPVSISATLTAVDGTYGGERVAGVAAHASLGGTLKGPLRDPVLAGQAAGRLQVARGEAGALSLSRWAANLAGPMSLRRAGIDGRLAAQAEGDGAWSGLGAPAPGDLPQVAALKRAARGFHMAAPAVALDLGGGRVSASLTQPVRLASASGARAELASRNAGAWRLAIQDGGLPSVEADLSRLSLVNGLGASTRLQVRGTVGVAEQAQLAASGRLSARDGRVVFAADRCAEVSATRLELGVNDVEHPAARLCPVAAPLFAYADGRWRVAGRAEGVIAAVPFLQARASAGAGAVTIDGRGGQFVAQATVRTLRLEDAAPERRFNAVQLAGTVGLARGVWQADFAAREASGHALGAAHLLHEGGLGAGFVTLDTGPLSFAAGGLQPDELSPLAAALGPPVTGQARFQGRFDWARAGVASTGALSLQGLDFVSAAGPVHGLSGEIAFQSLAPLVTAPDQTLRIAKVDAIVPVTDLSAKVGVTAGALQITGGEAAVGGGHVRIESLEVPFAAGAPVRGVLLFDAVQLHDLVEASPFGDRVDLDARVSGRVPFTSGPAGVRIAGGELHAVQAGRLSIQRTALTGVAAEAATPAPPSPPAPAAGPDPNATFTDFAYQAMENLAFDTLAASVQSQPDGRLGVLFHIVGRHDPPQHQEIRLGLMDLIRKRFLGQKLPLPSGTGVNLTLDTTLNLDDLLSDYAAFRRLHGSAGVQP
ncbi:MAG: YdbH domain-containing protein [Caulobacterales bacterium]|nr:YdbH domain-containing protein [Caulobacterales bacterium]